MSADGPNTRYLRVNLGSVFTAAALARSWREGRVEPDEILELDGKRLTFRQACSEDGYLRQEIGVLPSADGPKKRSWFEERRFRREAWRKIVKNGELGPAFLVERIEHLEQAINSERKRCDEFKNRLLLAERRENNLVSALRSGARDASELEAICTDSNRVRSETGTDDHAHEWPSRVLGRLATRLRSSLLEVTNDASVDIPSPDIERIKQINLFYNETVSEIDSLRRKLSEEQQRWTINLSGRKTIIQKIVREAKRQIESMEQKAQRNLDGAIQNYLQISALQADWRESVSKAFRKTYMYGRRFVIGEPWKQVSSWVSIALFSYAPTIAPESVLGIFVSGLFKNPQYGILVSWKGIHWRTAEKMQPSFLAWGWMGSITVTRGLLYGSILRLEHGREICTIRCAGPIGEIESFVDQINATNRSIPSQIPETSAKNEMRNVSVQAFQRLEEG